MSVASIAITGSTSVWVAGLHIHEEPAGSATDPTASSRSGDRHETQCWFRIWRRNRRPERVWDDVVCTAARAFVSFLFPSTGVTRLDLFEADICIACRREGSRGWRRRRIRDKIFCLLVEDAISR